MRPFLLSLRTLRQLTLPIQSQKVASSLNLLQCPSASHQRHIHKNVPKMRALGPAMAQSVDNNTGKQATGGPWCTSVRGATRKVVYVPPSKPPKFDYAGDLDKVLSPLDPSIPRPGFEDVEELKSMDPDVARLFSMEFATGKELLKRRLDDILEKVKDHPADVQSLEYKIARYTILIRNQMDHMQNHGHFKDKKTKSLLIRRIQARRKFMKHLQRHDSEKFEWLLKELKIKYIPANPVRKETKREVRIRLAEEKAEQIREAKVKAVKEWMKNEKAKFLVEKDEELSRIQKELQELGIEDDMSSIDGLINKLGVKEFIRPEEKKLSVRKQKLQMKFKLYAEGRKKGKMMSSS